MEGDILRLFSARCDLLALLPVAPKLADQIKRAGYQNRIAGSGLGQRLVERLLGGRNHLETGSVVGCNFCESRSGDGARSTRLGKDNFSGAGKELTSYFVHRLVAQRPVNQPDLAPREILFEELRKFASSAGIVSPIDINVGRSEERRVGEACR